MKNLKFPVNVLSLILLLSITACQINPFGSTIPEKESNEMSSPKQLKLESRPYIIAVNPISNSTISMDQIFEVEFNQKMDQATVEAALEFTPRIAGSFEWLNEKTMRFIPDQQLILDQDIRLTIHSSATSLTGTALGKSTEYFYTVTPSLRMTTNIPAFDKEEISPLTDAFYASFNLPVVDFSQPQKNTPAAFRIEPGIPGQGKWISSSTFAFFPEQGLVGGESYKLIMNRQLTSIYGSVLEVDQSMEWGFQTNAPEVVSVSPTNEQQINLDQQFAILFNQPMQTESVAINFRFRDIAGKPVSGRFIWNELATEMKFIPEQLLERGRVYILELLPGSQMKGGGAIKEKIDVSYSTIQTLNILSTNPLSGQPIDLIDNNNSVDIYFSTSLNPDIDLGEYIKVFPDAANLKMSLVDDGSDVTIQAEFVTGVSYQILISKDIYDRWGGRLGEDFLMNFVVSPSRPDIKVDYLYNGHTLVMHPDEYALEVEVINLPTVQTRIYALDFIKYIELIQNPENEISAEVIDDFRQPLTPLSNKQVSASLLLNLKKEGLTSGIYAVELSAEQMPTKRFFILVNHDYIISKLSENQLFVWAAEASSVESVKGQLITIKNDQAEVVFEGETSEQGVLIWDSFYGANPTSSIWIEIADKEKQHYSLINSAWIDFALPRSFGLNYQEKQEKLKVFWSLDKTVYSVQEELTGYGFIHLNEFGELRPPDFGELNLNLIDFYDQSQILFTFPIKVSPLGNFIFREKLPAQIPNGFYYLSFESLDVEKKYIQIQPKPLSEEFSLNVNLSKDQYFFDDTFFAKIDLDYRYGEYGKNIEFSWRIIAKELAESASSQDIFKNKLSDAYVLVDEGTGVLDESGGYDFLYPLAGLGEILHKKNVPYLISLEVTVGSEDEYIKFASKQAIIYPNRTNILVDLDPFYEQTNQIEAAFLTVDWQAAVSGAVSFDVKFQKLISAVDENLLDNQWVDLFQETLRSNGQGEAALTVYPNGPGVYRVIAGNNMFFKSKVFYVAGQALSAFPLDENGHLPLAVNKNEYIPGEQVQLFIPNPYPEPSFALITVEKENVSFYDVVPVESGQKVVKLDMDYSGVGTYFISVVLISKNTHQIVQGYTTVNLNTNLEELTITSKFLADSNKISVSVLDKQGNPINGELLIQIIRNETPTSSISEFENLKNTFLESNSIGVVTSGIVQNEALIFQSLDNLVIPNEISVPPQKNNQISWQELRQIDSDGKYILDLNTIPIDTFDKRIFIIGVGEGLRFGSLSIEIPAIKTVEAIINIPKKVYEGDVFEILVTLNNMMDNSQTIQASIDLYGLSSDFAPVIDISLPVGSQKPIFWKVNGDTIGKHEIVLKVKNPAEIQYEYHLSIDVIPTPKSRQLVKSGKIEKRDEIDIRFMTSQSKDGSEGILNVGVITALSGMLDPSLSSLPISTEFENEDTALILLATLKLLQLENEMAVFDTHERNFGLERIKQNIDHLIKNQNIDGGWGINTSQRHSDMQTTLISTWALRVAQDDGYQVTNTVLEDAANYILAGLPAFEMLSNTTDYDLLAWQYYILSLLKVENIDPLLLLPNIESNSPAGKAMISMGINEVWPTDPRSRAILADLKNELITDDAAAFWENNLSTIRLFANDLQTTAFIVFIMSEQDPAENLLPKLVDWLYAQQTEMWAWRNTYESSLSLMAISATLLGRGIPAADYAASVALNGTQIVTIQPPYDPFKNSVQAQIGGFPLLMGEENIITLSRGEGKGDLYYHLNLKSTELDFGISKPINMAAINRFVIPSDLAADPSCSSIELCTLSDFGKYKKYQPVDILLQIIVFEQIDHLVVKENIPSGFTIINTPYLLKNQAMIKFQPLISKSDTMIFDQAQKNNALAFYAETIPSGTYYLQYTLLPEFMGDYFWPAVDVFSLSDDAVSAFAPGLTVEITP